MKPGILKIYSENKLDLEKFLTLFFEKEYILENKEFYQIDYENPIQMLDILSCYTENSDKFKLNFWISLDEGVFILISDKNIDEIIKYIYERYPDK